MDAVVRFFKRLLSVAGKVIVVSLAILLILFGWNRYVRYLDLSYATNHEDWQYLSWLEADVQWRRYEAQNGQAQHIVYRRIISHDHMVSARFDEGRFRFSGYWKADCEPGEVLELPLFFGGKNGIKSEKVKQTLHCHEIGGSTWYVAGRSTSKPVSMEKNVSGFYMKEDFTHPRWGGFVEGQRLDAIETARRASAEE